jgi:hypothetical protein
VKGFAGLREEWEKLTKPARKPFWDDRRGGPEDRSKALMPEIATETNKTFAVLATVASTPILKDLRGAGAKDAIGFS